MAFTRLRKGLNSQAKRTRGAMKGVLTLDDWPRARLTPAPEDETSSSVDTTAASGKPPLIRFTFSLAPACCLCGLDMADPVTPMGR